MDPWAAQTSLQVLEWIAAASSDENRAAQTGHIAAALPRLEQLLRGLATKDASFQNWLDQQGDSAWNEHGPSGDSTDNDRWLVALAGAGTQCVEVGMVSRNPVADDGDPPVRADVRLMCLVFATARVALAARAAARRSFSDEAEIARHLAYDMAYGLSHELNNPLANIASRARLLAEEEPSDRKRQLLSGIVDQAMRGCEMIADLMWVARPPQFAVAPFDVRLLLDTVIAQARPWTDARRLELRFDAKTFADDERQFTITADPTAVREAIWALLRNAIEVARQRIVVELTVVELTGAELTGAGPAAVISISDDGPGLSDEARKHAFHPYFSGREAGRGLGLGLAKADRIARLSGGYVTIDNLPEGGCVARITWPRA